MIFDYSDYQQFLRDLLANRISKNSYYSLRSMALAIEVAPSTLSDVMRGKKNFSAKTAAKVSEKLKLKIREKKYFNLLVQYKATKSKEMKSFLEDSLKRVNPRKIEFQDLSPDHFQLISEWYHLPTLELTYLDKFIFNIENVAKALNISTFEAETAINRLKRLDLIEKNINGRYQKTSQHVLVKSNIKNIALQNYHAQMLDKAKKSLTAQTPGEKCVGSENVSISKENLDEAKIIIEECFQKIIKLSEKQDKKESIYHLGIQFFNLTKNLDMEKYK